MKCSGNNAKIVQEHISEMTGGSGQVCRLNMWKLKKKLCPQNIDPPMAKMNDDGDLVSNPDALKQLYVDTYKDRLRHRVIRPGYEELETLKDYLFSVRLTISKTRKSKPWTEGQLMKVLKSLKTGKSADALGFINEMFRPEVIGCDLVG